MTIQIAMSPSDDTGYAIQTKKPPKPRIGWRLPGEVMGKVAEALMDDGALGTLASLQSTSSAMYDVATPLLYRHITFTPNSAAQFLNLFNEISMDDYHLFLNTAPYIIQRDTHLLDQNTVDRLRSYLAYTRSLSLELRTVIDDDCDLYPQLLGYRNLARYVLARDGGGLWPDLKRCHIDLKDWNQFAVHPDGKRRYGRHEWSGLVTAIFARIRPKYLSVVLPDPGKINTSYTPKHPHFTYWPPSITSFQADHVGLTNFSTHAQHLGIPRAMESLTILFKMWPRRKGSSSRLEDLPYPFPDAVKHRLLSIFSNHLGQFNRVKNVRFIGLTKRHEDEAPGTYEDLQQAEAVKLLKRWMRGVMEKRVVWRNREEVKVAILPDTSPESEVEAEWYTYKVPERK